VFPEEVFFVLRRKLSFIGVLVVIGCLVGFGCDGDPVRPVIPVGPSQPFPAHNSTDVSQVPVFSWLYGDTTSQSTTYSFYLATSTPPALIDSLLIDTLYDPGPLRAGTKYYWRIVAHNASGRVVSSPTWSFTTSSDFVFPLAIGNSWSYTRKFYKHNCEPDSLPGSFRDTIFGSSTTLVQSLDTLLDSIEAYRLHTVSNGNFGGSEYNSYRNNTQDGFYQYAYGGTGIWPPRVTSSNGTYLEFMGMRFRDLRELRDIILSNVNVAMATRLDSIVYEDPPLQWLAYPLEIGQRWIFRDGNEGAALDMEMEVLSLENIQSPAGEFECFKIRWFLDFDNDGQWESNIDGYDYLSPVGVIRREFLFYNITVMDEQNVLLGTCDYVDEYELTDYHLERD